MVLRLMALAIVCVASLFGCIYYFCMAGNESTKGFRGEKDYSVAKYSAYLAFAIVLTVISFLSCTAIVICIVSLFEGG